MAHVRQRKENEADENPVKQVAAGKVTKASVTAQPAKRRALGDIGNTVSTVTTRNQAKAKGETVKVLDAVKPAAGVKTRSQRLAEKNAASKNATALVTAPRTRSQVAAANAAAVEARKQGVSMSALLQQRSEQATAPPQPQVETQPQQQEEVPPPSPLPDIDQVDAHNPLAETKYANDIHEYYRRVEPVFKVAADYMKIQTDINEKMRAILIDWLVEVHLKFKLMPETLFLTVNLIDRYLQEHQVGRKDLQLVGVTAMLIASKYEEIWAPEVRDFVYISDKAYTREQILAQEKAMLKCLKFNLTLPTAYNFLGRFLKAAGCQLDKQVMFLTSYLVELTLPEYSMLQYNYSLISAAAVHVALKIFNRNDPYPKALAKHSTYSLEDIRPCAQALVDLLQKAPLASLNAVHKKYSNAKFQEIAKDNVIQEFLNSDSRML